MKKLFLLSFPFLLIACSSDDEQKPVEVPQGPLAQSSNSAKFNAGFDKLLSNYYALHNAFVQEDMKTIVSSATALQKAADSLAVNELKADTAIIETAKFDAQNISDDAKALVGEKDIESMRKSFAVISNMVLELTRTVKFDKAAVYLIHCPMAFNNTGADWLSKDTNVVNPYLPKDMPNCGEVKDSIDYRVK